MTFSIFERKRHFLAGAYGPRRNQPENYFWRIFSLAPHLFICSAGASFVRWRLISGASFVPSLI